MSRPPGSRQTATEHQDKLLSGWQLVSIGSIATVDSGPAFKSRFFGAPGEGTRLLRGDNIQPGHLRWERTRTWPNELIFKYKHLLLAADDIILAMDRPLISAGLKIARVAQHDLPALLVQRVARIHPKGQVDSSYLYHILESPAFINHLRGNEVGTQLPHITLESIREFRFPLPPLHEQRRIVDILEDHLSRLAAAGQYLVAAARRGHSFTAALLWQLTHNHPAGTAVRLSDIAEVRLGRQRSPKNHTGDRMRPYLRAANVGWNELRLDDVKEMQFSAEESVTYELQAGDILLTEASGSSSEVGKSAIYRGELENACFQNTLLRVRCHSAEPEFIQKFLLAEALRGRFMTASRGVGIHHLGHTRLATWEICLPPPDVQVAISAAADQALLSGQDLRAELFRSTRATKALRRSLLNAAFSGRLTGRAADAER